MRSNLRSSSFAPRRTGRAGCRLHFTRIAFFLEALPLLFLLFSCLFFSLLALSLRSPSCLFSYVFLLSDVYISFPLSLLFFSSLFLFSYSLLSSCLSLLASPSFFLFFPADSRFKCFVTFKELAGRDLTAMDAQLAPGLGGSSDPYVAFVPLSENLLEFSETIQPQKVTTMERIKTQSTQGAYIRKFPRTHHKTTDLNPVWTEEIAMEFSASNPEELSNKFLAVTVMDHDLASEDDLIGTLVLNCGDLVKEAFDDKKDDKKGGNRRRTLRKSRTDSLSSFLRSSLSGGLRSGGNDGEEDKAQKPDNRRKVLKKSRTASATSFLKRSLMSGGSLTATTRSFTYKFDGDLMRNCTRQGRLAGVVTVEFREVSRRWPGQDAFFKSGGAGGCKCAIQ